MALDNSVSLSISLNGVGLTVEQGGTDFTFEVDIDEVIPVAKVGSLTVRTDANTGTLTMAADHGIITGDRLDIYWTDGDGINYCQRGVVVGTVSVNSVPIDSGVGTDLPAVDSAITAMVPQFWTGSVTEANIEGWYATIVGTTLGAQVCVGTGTFTENAAFLLNGTVWTSPVAGWSDGIPGWTSPLDAATTITRIYYSHGDSVNEATFRMKLGHN